MDIKKSFHMGLLFSSMLVITQNHAMEISNEQEMFRQLFERRGALSFDNSDLNDADVCSLATKLCGTKLTNISLIGNKCGATGLKALVDRLSTTTINTLSIGYNKIDDDGIQYMCSHPASKQLKYIDVQGNPISDIGRMALAKFLHDNPSTIIVFTPDVKSKMFKNAFGLPEVATSATIQPNPMICAPTPKTESNLINMIDNDGYAPIHRALGLGDKMVSNKFVQLLLTQKADVNIKTTYGNGWTPLHYAAHDVANGSFFIPQLLAIRADICITDVHRCTPFALAVMRNNFEAAKLLLPSSTKNATLTTVNSTTTSDAK